MKAIYLLAFQIINIYEWIVIIHVILSWLVAFNILNTQSRFVYSVLDFTYRATSPILNKIKNYIPNFQFAEKAVINNSQITNRRINWIIGVEYRTTGEQLKNIKDQIENYIRENKDFAVNDNAILSVKIDQFAASSIDIKLICFTKTKQYQEWMNVKDTLAMEIKNIVEKNKASFAFPSSSIYVEKN